MAPDELKTYTGNCGIGLDTFSGLERDCLWKLLLAIHMSICECYIVILAARGPRVGRLGDDQCARRFTTNTLCVDGFAFYYPSRDLLYPALILACLRTWGKTYVAEPRESDHSGASPLQILSHGDISGLSLVVQASSVLNSIYPNQIGPLRCFSQLTGPKLPPVRI